MAQQKLSCRERFGCFVDWAKFFYWLWTNWDAHVHPLLANMPAPMRSKFVDKVVYFFQRDMKDAFPSVGPLLPKLMSPVPLPYRFVMQIPNFKYKIFQRVFNMAKEQDIQNESVWKEETRSYTLFQCICSFNSTATKFYFEQLLPKNLLLITFHKCNKFVLTLLQRKTASIANFARPMDVLHVASCKLECLRQIWSTQASRTNV